MKVCQIYKTKSEYKIVTMYRLESWSYISSKPIVLLPSETTIEQLSKEIFFCLKSSRELSEAEENEFWLGEKLLSELKEKSFNSFYNKSTSCNLSLENNILEISPQEYLGKNKGLSTIENEVEKVEYNPNVEIEVTNQIVKILKNSYPTA